MKMKLLCTNISEKILKLRNKRNSEAALMDEVQKILKEESAKDEKILNALQENCENESNHFDFLSTDKIFHISNIEKICIDYRLRFLNSSLFKGELPYEAISKIKQLEEEHKISLKAYKIMAPSQFFKLKNADDPFLFAPIGNQYYYLIHSWGRDLHPLRKLMMWPFKHLENFIVLLLLSSLILTALIPNGMFSPQQTTSQFLIIYLFMFKWISGLAIFFGFKKGKNFSSAVWNSKYFNT
ncbi:MAG: hypothetical protein JJE07_01420 [Flavobacteriaceae bacterium]|nr:hypothetical protein [Flavobacteriaceae bacterium]